MIYGKLVDYPEYMPVFTTENALDYMINQKESDCMHASKVLEEFQWRRFKLFKEGHIQNVMINRLGAVCLL